MLAAIVVACWQWAQYHSAASAVYVADLRLRRANKECADAGTAMRSPCHAATVVLMPAIGGGSYQCHGDLVVSDLVATECELLI
jgi:hypothetical protein